MLKKILEITREVLLYDNSKMVQRVWIKYIHKRDFRPKYAEKTPKTAVFPLLCEKWGSLRLGESNSSKELTVKRPGTGVDKSTTDPTFLNQASVPLPF